MYHHLIIIFVEPTVAHHHKALFEPLFSPAVLHSPAVRQAVFIQIDAHEHHCVRHQAVADKKNGLPIDYIDPEEGNFTLIEAVAVVDKGENTNPNAMKIAECIIKNARAELLQNYPVALYQGESVDEELKPKNPQTFPEKLTTELLVKHQKLVKGE